MSKAVQYFSDEYLEHCKKMSPLQIAQFLEDFRLLQLREKPRGKSKLISMKVPEHLLSAFKAACEVQGVPYQSRIKDLMRDYLLELRA